MKRTIGSLLMVFCFLPLTAVAQNVTQQWSLQDCLDYALEHNIQIRKSQLSQLSGQEDLKQAKAQLFPSLSASLSQGFSNYPSGNADQNNTFNGNYNLNASWTLLDGGSRLSTIKQQEKQNQMNVLNIEQNEDDIRIAIVQTYLQVMYAQEAVNICKQTVDVSKAQLEQSAGFLAAGATSRVEYAQMESQYNNDKYQLVVTENNLANYKLQLKQLLELDITDEIELVNLSIPDEQVLAILPDKQSIYANALELRPEIKSSELSIDIAELEINKAKSASLPSLSLSAGIGTGYMSGGLSFDDQLWNRLNENVGLSLSIPILNNRKNKTAVNKARYALNTYELEKLNAEKTLLRTVEGICLDATSAQSQFIAAKERMQYVDESYRLTQEQFALGMKNTVELITEKNNHQVAQQELVQTKYTALMNIQLLNIYQKQPISIE